MVGTKLVPLNQMHGSMPELRKKYLEKYKGREEILEFKIPLLDCLWNDVVQLLPLHPQKVFSLQKELGIIAELPPYRYYKIPIERLDPARAVVFFKSAPGEESTSVKWLGDVDLGSLQSVPSATKDYYESLIGTDELPFNYQFIPHVVHKGVIDVSDIEIITLNNT